MDTVVTTSTNVYPVRTGYGLLDDIKKHLPFDVTGKKVMVVSDDSVAKIYLDKVCAQLSAIPFVFPHGENSKSFAYAEKITSALAENKFTRSDFIFALGGGVTGDLSGFVASIYMRGIPYVQLPTTLLAGIDSSVGGKTAVNIPYGKNLVGRIYPPKAVLYDLKTLSTLPSEYVRDGVGEGLKYAILDGNELFDIMERCAPTGGDYLGNFTDDDLERFVDLCVGYKKRIVEADENENSVRRLLNLGHTLGHSLERKSNLTITHGVCVSMGLKLIAEASYRQNFLSKNDRDRIMNLLDKYGVTDCPYHIKELVGEVAVDKKTVDNAVNLVTIHGIGDCRITNVPLSELEDFFG